MESIFPAGGTGKKGYESVKRISGSFASSGSFYGGSPPMESSTGFFSILYPGTAIRKPADLHQDKKCRKETDRIQKF